MNINDLKNIKIDINSIKNFSFDDVRNFINEQQQTSLNIAMILGVLIVVIGIYNFRAEEYTGLNSKLQELQTKEEPVRKYENVLKQRIKFQKEIPRSIAESNFIPHVTDLANKRNVVINSFEPAQIKVKGFYRETFVKFTCSSMSLNNLILFIHDLEHSGYFMKVDSWDVINPLGRAVIKGGDSKGISAFIGVSSIELMDNEQKKSKKK